MKKILLIIMAAILCASPLAAAFTIIITPENIPSKSMPSTTMAFTHKVFIEEGTTSWCPNCPNAAEALYSLYNSSEYPFFFVALISNQNPLAQDRFWGHYRGMAIPTIFLDGGFIQTVGSGTTPEQTEQLYRPLIEDAGERTVHPLELTTSATGLGDATLDITVTVKNTGTKPYFGFVRSYVTEIVSRWVNYNGDPYHFGFLDYAIKKFVFLGPQKTKTFTMTWDGAAQHGNHTFADITDENIMLITAVAHWQPHIVEKEQYIGTHFAFYVDQTDGVQVNQDV
jgi:hypothetical protein